jgi:uncharacterized protein YbjT (DUF2867 family)
MKAIVFGATGMVGQCVVRVCLESPEVTELLLVGRSSARLSHPKVRELLQADLFDWSKSESQLKGYDGCFFCLGVSSVGMSEADYTRISYDLTMAAAKALVKLNPGMTFCYVSGANTDSTEKGKSMWARVKGKTENALIAAGFKGAYMFRPGLIRPMYGVKSRTAAYRAFYATLGWTFPIWKALAPSFVTTGENIGRAMIRCVTTGYAKQLLENDDINALGAART